MLFLLGLTASAQIVILQDGTPVKLRLSRTVSSADARVGETVDLEVLDDVFLDKDIVISKGATALAVVTAAQPKRRIGRRGKLSMNIDSVRLTNGGKAALRGTKSVEGGSPGVAMGIGIGASAVLFFPAAPFFLLMHGSDTTIPQGAEVTTYINGDVRLDQSTLPKVDTIPTRMATAPRTVTAAPLLPPCIQTSTGACR
jgi:hypothetical protein